MREHDDIRRPRAEFDDRFEIPRRRVLLCREFDMPRMLGLGEPRIVRRRGHALDFHGGVNLHVDLQIAQRVLLQEFALERIAVAVLVPLQRQHLRVRNHDALLGARRDRVDAGFEDVATGPFEQTRVALLAQDRLVNFAGPLLLDDVRFDEFVADPHTETRDRRVRREREMEHPFEHTVRAVDERFLDDGPRDLIADVDRDVVIAHRQWHVPAVDRRDQRPERLGRRGTFEPLQPEGIFLDADELAFLDADELPAVDFHSLLVRAEQFDGRTGRCGDFDLPGDDVNRVCLRQFHGRMRTDDHGRRRQ